MPDLTPDQIASVSPGYWALLKQIRLQSGLFTFKGREYQVEPMSSKARRICYMKGAQCFGATELESIKDIHGLIYKKYPKGVLHSFPNDDEVSEFGKSRFKPLVSANKSTIGRYMKGTDTDSLKQINGGFLYLRGARLNQKIGETGENTASKTSGFSVDRVVFDEVDYMDTNVIEKYKGRMGDSAIKEEVYLGNPSHEDHGIHKIFQTSDQRYWHRKCSCGHWTCAEKSFPNCIKIRNDGTGYIGCDKCGKEVPMWAGDGTGQWVADFPSKSDYMHGYMASQLMNPRTDPAEILEDFTNPPNGNLADVYRLRLGVPYSAQDEKLRKDDVLANCGGNISPQSHLGPCAMGVDVGKIAHVVIGVKIDKDRYEIIKTCKVDLIGDDFRPILDLAKRYNVKSDVIDKLPYEASARKYQRESGHKTFLCQYKDNSMQESVFNDNTGVVVADRTAIFDTTHRLLATGCIRLPSRSVEVEEFARQCCNTAKFEEKDKKRGTVVFRYRPTGDCQEHYRNALNYFVLAAKTSSLARVGNTRINRPTKAINEYQRI